MHDRPIVVRLAPMGETLRPNVAKFRLAQFFLDRVSDI